MLPQQMPMSLGVKTIKVSAKIPITHERALKQMARDNGRSIASEMRIALETHLRKDGRIIEPKKPCGEPAGRD